MDKALSLGSWLGNRLTTTGFKAVQDKHKVALGTGHMPRSEDGVRSDPIAYGLDGFALVWRVFRLGHPAEPGFGLARDAPSTCGSSYDGSELSGPRARATEKSRSG